MIAMNKELVKKIKTCNLYLAFIALGLCMAIPGPSLVDLQHIVGTDIQHIALIYPARATGYLLGCLLGGIIFDKFQNQELLLIILNFFMSLFIFITPWCRALKLLIAVMTGCGLTMGAIDTGGNVYCLNIWGEKSGPFYQALHFAFSIGGFIAPLIAAPFLTTFSDNVQSSCANQTDFANSTNNACVNEANITIIENLNTSSEEYSIPKVTYAYAIICGYNLLVTLSFTIMLIFNPKERKHSKEDAAVSPKSKLDKKIVFGIVSLTCTLLGVYAGIEIGFAQMVATYAVKSNMNLSKSEASYVTSFFWGTFSVARGLSVCLALKFSCLSLLVSDLILVFIAAIILLTLGTVYKAGLWVGSGILGFGIASFFPSAIAWIERYITVSNRIASIIVVGAALGEMVIPLLISQFVDKTPAVLFYIILASNILCSGILFAMWMILRTKKEKYEEKKTVNNETNQPTVLENTRF